METETDKYADQRFDQNCPTCGQEFMQEKIDILVEALQRAIDEAVADDFHDWFANARVALSKVGAA